MMAQSGGFEEEEKPSEKLFHASQCACDARHISQG